MIICDFCSDPAPVWRLVCPSFQLPGDAAMSEGDWLACETCAGLIKADSWAKLAGRSVEKTETGKVLAQVMGRTDAAIQVMALHGEFRRRFTGEAKRIV